MSTKVVDLDDRTILIVHGFIRKEQKELLLHHQKDPYYDIPPLVIQTILQHVFDYFMLFNATFKITKSVSELLKCSVGQKFEFSRLISNKLQWRVALYPNGTENNEKGRFCYKLAMSRRIKFLKHVYAQTIVQCKELNAKLTTMGKFGASYSQNTLFLLSRLKDIDATNITIIIKIVTFRLVCNDNLVHYQLNNIYKLKQKFSFNWKINDKLMKKMIDSKYSEFYESNMKYGMWLMRIWPHSMVKVGKNNLKKRERSVLIQLQLCGLPPDITTMIVSFTFTLKQALIIETRKTEMNVNDQCGAIRLPFKKFQKHSNIVLNVDIKVQAHFGFDYKLIDPYVVIQKQQDTIDILKKKLENVTNQCKSNNIEINKLKNDLQLIIQKIDKMSH